MILYHSLNTLLDSDAKVRILRFLIHGGERYTGRAISRMTGASQTKCVRALRELQDSSVINSEKQGKSYLYSANSDSILFKPLFDLFESESNLTLKLATIVNECLGVKVESILLFGSAARREETESSDIDLLIVSDIAPNSVSLEEMVSTGFKTFGRQLSAICYSKNELRKRWRRKDPLVKNMYKDGKSIFGLSKGDLFVGN